MVLRGSKTKPVADPVSVKHAIDEARAYLEQTSQLEIRVEQEATKLISQALEDVRSDNLNDKTHIQIPISVTKSLKVLLDRLEYLEQQHKETEEQLQAYQEKLIISLKQLGCGGLAGMTARTCVAPVDRIKLLIQTSGTLKTEYKGIYSTLKSAISEGI